MGKETCACRKDGDTDKQEKAKPERQFHPRYSNAGSITRRRRPWLERVQPQNTKALVVPLCKNRQTPKETSCAESSGILTQWLRIQRYILSMSPDASTPSLGKFFGSQSPAH